jgi:hypothetical protein
MFPPSEIEFKKSKEFLDLVKKHEADGCFPNAIRCEAVPIANGFGTEFTSPAAYSNDQERVLNESTFYIQPDKVPIEDNAPINDLRAFKVDEPLKGSAFDARYLISSGMSKFRKLAL